MLGNKLGFVRPFIPEALTTGKNVWSMMVHQMGY